MAQLIDDIELAWSSLRDREDASGWRSIPITTIGPCTLRAGLRFPEKNEAVLVSFSTTAVPVAEKLPEAQGFVVSRVESESDGLIWLSLTRSAPGSKVTDVASAMFAEPSAHEKRMLRIFLGRIRAWQEFMRRGGRALSAESEIGLVGELMILRAVIDEGLPLASAIESWVGPLDGVRDFEIGTGALEVKTTTSFRGFPAKVGSLEQLDDSARQPLFVAGVRLHQAESGQSLPELVAEIRDITAGEAEAVRLLSERLIASGYLDTHADCYARRFTLAEISILEVKDGFPRLTAGSVPLGIMKAAYEIDLDKAEGSRVRICDALKKLGVI